MKRKDIEKKFSYILEKMPVNPKEGDCYEILDSPIQKQLKNLKEGSGKIFFLKVGKISDDEMKMINIELVSENVYISPTEY